MMLLVLALQAAPTVGDTVWVSRTVPIPAQWSARAPAWEPDAPVELLGRPVLDLLGDSVRVRYPLVAWQPGSFTVEIPGPVLLSPEGRVDSVDVRPVTLTITSVLPRVPADSLLPIQPPTDIVPRPYATPWPLVWSLALAMAALIPLHWWWRRRGPPAPAADEAPPPVDPPVAHWAALGESRAVAAAAGIRLRQAIAAGVPRAGATLDVDECVSVLRDRKPGWPVDEIHAFLERLENARYAHAPDHAGEDAMTLYQEAVALADRLGSGS